MPSNWVREARHGQCRLCKCEMIWYVYLKNKTERPLETYEQPNKVCVVCAVANKYGTPKSKKVAEWSRYG